MLEVFLGSVRMHGRRYIAALLAIALSIGFMVMVSGINSAANDGATASIARQFGNAQYIGHGWDEPQAFADYAEKARTYPRVSAVAVNSSGYVDMAAAKTARNISVGTVPTDEAARWQNLTEGRFPSGSEEVLVGSRLAADHDISVGDGITIGNDDQQASLRVVGLASNDPGLLDAAVWIPEEATGLLKAWAFPDSVTIVGDADDGIVEYLSSEKWSLSTSNLADFSVTARSSLTGGVDVMGRLAMVFGVIALFVGALVIANTFGIVMAQRARDFALLRCVGAAPGQVRRSLLAEAAVIGVAGTALGVGLGIAGSYLAASQLDRFFPEVAMGTPGFSLVSLLVPVALGLIVTVIAAWAPVRRAASNAPVEAMRPLGQVTAWEGAGRLRLVGGTVVFIAGIALMSLMTSVSLPGAMAGGILSFVGFMIAAPHVVPPLMRCRGLPVARFSGVASLAVEHAQHDRRRATSAVVSLVVSVTLLVLVIAGIRSLETYSREELDSSLPLDVAISATEEITGADVEAFAGIGGVEKVAPLGVAEASLGGVKTTAVELTDEARSLLRDPDFAAPQADTVLIGPDATELMDMVGEQQTLTIAGQERAVRVASLPFAVDGVVVSDLGGEPATLRQLWLKIDVDDDPDESLERVRSLADDRGWQVTADVAERMEFSNILTAIYAVVVSLLAVAVVIAVVGVNNTLSLSVIERRREHALLRALGMERRSLARMLMIEGCLLAVSAVVIATVLGLTYAAFGVKAISDGVGSSPMTLTVPWLDVTVIAVAAVFVAIIASVVPGVRASRVAPAEGLSID